MLLLAVLFAACSNDDNPVVPPAPSSGTTISYHLATADEARWLMQGNTEHYARMSQIDIDWRLKTTVVRGMHRAEPYATPELIANITDLLKQYK